MNIQQIVRVTERDLRFLKMREILREKETQFELFAVQEFRPP